MKVVYIAGPFRGLTTWDIHCNVHRAETVALEVARMGAMPLCPHANTRHFHGQLTGEFWLDGTMALMERCDAVLLIDGWSHSEGSRAEARRAKVLEIPVFESLDGLRGWLASADSMTATEPDKERP